MIDLHCHLLPGIDDGATDLETSLAMARIAADDGITVTACTPHIMPGVYDNVGDDIKRRIGELQGHLTEAGIEMKLVCGADTHIAPDLAKGLKDGRIPTLNDSRYFLFEPPHHIPPPRLEHTVFDAMSAGYRPILTHPERLSWIEDHYETMVKLAHAGAWMQITCGAITGNFGKRPQYWAERMLDEGLVHILATDAHNLRNRKPIMSKARDMVTERLGEQAAIDMVLTRPSGVLDNAPPDTMPETVGAPKPAEGPGLFARLFAGSGKARNRKYV